MLSRPLPPSPRRPPTSAPPQSLALLRIWQNRLGRCRDPRLLRCTLVQLLDARVCTRFLVLPSRCHPPQPPCSRIRTMEQQLQRRRQQRAAQRRVGAVSARSCLGVTPRDIRNLTAASRNRLRPRRAPLRPSIAQQRLVESQDGRATASHFLPRTQPRRGQAMRLRPTCITSRQRSSRLTISSFRRMRRAAGG